MQKKTDDSFFTIEIGSRNLKMVEMVKSNTGKMVIKNYAIASTPEGFIQDGVLLNVQKMTEAIESVLKKNEFRAKRVKLILSGSYIISENIEMANDNTIFMEIANTRTETNAHATTMTHEIQPTAQATLQATAQATEQATIQATAQATAQATKQATVQATIQATIQATAQATKQATVQATKQATAQATEQAITQVEEQAIQQAVMREVKDKTIKEQIKSILLRQYPEVPFSTYEVGFRVLNQNEMAPSEAMRIFATAVPKDVVDSCLQMLIELGFIPVSIDSAANHLDRCFHRVVSMSQEQGFLKDAYIPFAVLDFGAQHSVLHIFEKNQLVYSRAISIGSSRIDEAIVRRMFCSPIEAEIMKKQYGMHLPEYFNPREKKGYEEGVEAILNTLASEVYEALETYYQKTLRSSIQSIDMMGGGSYLKGLSEYMTNAFQIPCAQLLGVNTHKVEFAPNLNSENLAYLIHLIDLDF